MKTRIRQINLSTWQAAALLAIYAGIIFFISSMPRPTRDLHLPTGTIPHFIEYSGLGLLAGINALLWRRRNRKIRPWIWCIAWFSAALYAASDEIHQMFVPCRSAELADWLVDITGISCALIILKVITLRRLIYVKLRKCSG